MKFLEGDLFRVYTLLLLRFPHNLELGVEYYVVLNIIACKLINDCQSKGQVDKLWSSLMYYYRHIKCFLARTKENSVDLFKHKSNHSHVYTWKKFSQKGNSISLMAGLADIKSHSI